MATSALSGVPLYQPRANDLNGLIQGLQAGQAIQQAPQNLANQQLNQLLQNAILKEKLLDLQDPNRAIARQINQSLAVQAANPNQTGVVSDPVTAQAAAILGGPISRPRTVNVDETTGAITQVAPAQSSLEGILASGRPTGFVRDQGLVDAQNLREQEFAKAGKVQEVNGQLVQYDIPSKTYKPVYGEPTAKKSPFTQQQVVSLTNPKDTKFIIPDASGAPPQGYMFVKDRERLPTPAEKLNALEFVQRVYEKNPTTLSYYGQGQLPGSEEIKTRLDAVLRPVNGDFNKLNPQAKDSFLFAMNNLRDPRSATLLAESNQIAERMGIGDRFKTYVSGLESGARVSPQVAKEIYDVVSQTHALQEERLIDQLIQRKRKLEEVGGDLEDIGIPQKMIDKVNAKIAQGAATPTAVAPNASKDFPSEAEARKAGFKNGDTVIIGGVQGVLE